MKEKQKDKYKRYADELKPITDCLGIKLASVEQMLSVYPDEFLGMEFRDEKTLQEARKKYSETTIKQLINAFRSHRWHFTSDIYGHDGLSKGGCCLECKRKIKLPYGDWTDDFILVYHYVYGRYKRFGGRIIKCKKKIKCTT